MFAETRSELIRCLEQAGMKTVLTSRKKLQISMAARIGAVLFEDENLSVDGSKRIYTDELDRRRKRRRKYSREVVFNVIIGEASIEEVQKIYDLFLKELPDGLYVDGNYVSMTPERADWLDDEDSIIKAKCAVQLTVRCTGGIYQDTDFRHIEKADITAEKE